MESVKDLVARQSKELIESKPPLTPRLSRDTALVLKTLFDQMLAYYPNQEFSQDTITGFQFDMERLVTQYGLEMVKEALLRLRLRPSQKFFPHPTEVAEELAVMTEDKRRQLLKEHPYVPCGECDPPGISIVVKDGVRYADDCVCKKRWSREHKALKEGTPSQVDAKARAAGEQ